MVIVFISVKQGKPIVHKFSAEIGFNIVPIQLPFIHEEGKHEPRGRKNQEFIMVGRFNRTTDFGNSRGFIFTV
jgi:hypothetical protein